MPDEFWDQLRTYAKADGIIPEGPAIRCLKDEILIDYHAGRLSPTDFEDVQDHLAHCSACRANLREAVEFVSDTPQASTPGNVDVGAEWTRFSHRMWPKHQVRAQRRLP